MMMQKVATDYVELRFGPRWTYISSVRKFVANFFMIGLADKERAECISMAASELLEKAVVQEQALGTLPNDRGAALYNLACFYATTGQPDKALPLLPQALRLRPDLVEWSKQDSDLDVLRDLPAFKALYEA